VPEAIVAEKADLAVWQTRHDLPGEHKEPGAHDGH
jgi:hypothetical protein